MAGPVDPLDGERAVDEGARMLGTARSVGLIGVSDLDSARTFYGGTLGLPLGDESPYALVAVAGDTMLRITAVGTPVVAPYSVAGWRVGDIAATMDELGGRGVVFTRYEGVGQDDRGVWTAPDGTMIAWFADPDGNNLSLIEFPSRR